MLQGSSGKWLSDPGRLDCPRVQNVLELGVVHGYALPIVSAQIGVELVDGLGN